MATEQQKKYPTVFTNAGNSVASYEHSFSQLSYTYMNDSAMIALAPILKEKVGKKDFKKGDSVYNYDEKLGATISVENAVALLEGIELLETDDSYAKIVVETNTTMISRAITIFRPNTIKLSGQLFPNFILKVAVTKKDEENRAVFHLFNTTTLKVVSVAKEEQEIEINYDLNVFKKFLASIIDNGFGVALHAAKRASGFSGGSSSTRPKRESQEVVEEEELDSEQSTKSKKASSNFDEEFQE